MLVSGAQRKSQPAFGAHYNTTSEIAARGIHTIHAPGGGGRQDRENKDTDFQNVPLRPIVRVGDIVYNCQYSLHLSLSPPAAK